MLFKITPATSRLTNALSTDAFGAPDNPGDDTLGPDALTVDAGAYLIAMESLSDAAFLAPTGAWTVTVNGSVFSTSVSGNGITLASGNAAASTITIGVDGEVGGFCGIRADSSVTIKNAGEVAGSLAGIYITTAGTRSITNSGTISGSYSIFDNSGGLSNDTVTNSGLLDGDAFIGKGKLTNSGLVDGGVGIEGKLANSGTINGDVFLGDNTAVTNSGTIIGKVDANPNTVLTNSGAIDGGVSGSTAGTTLTITNSGTISGPHSILDLSDGTNDTVMNSGLLDGDVELYNGANKLANSGTINGFVKLAGVLTNSGKINGYVLLYENDILTNSGTIDGDIAGSGLNQTVTNFAIINGVMKSGSITGPVDLWKGDDKFFGGSKSETVKDGDGADIVKLGGGKDLYIATGNTGTDGNDTIDGGTGIDTYDASAAISQVHINLDTIAHGDAAKTATGSNVGNDSITGFENANGGSFGDTISGSAAANSLNGGGGSDHLVGYGGDDMLIGGPGADNLVGGDGKDTLLGGDDGDLLSGEGGDDMLSGGPGGDALSGGAGKDTLTGGADADSFFYAALSDSGITKATRDVITDFEDGVDIINLSTIDANTTLAGDQNFKFAGTNILTGFSGDAGELHAYWTLGGQIIEGDVNGDKKADFSIAVTDPTHSIAWSNVDGVDFFL